jgi:hypothetical protein
MPRLQHQVEQYGRQFGHRIERRSGQAEVKMAAQIIKAGSRTNRYSPFYSARQHHLPMPTAIAASVR